MELNIGDKFKIRDKKNPEPEFDDSVWTVTNAEDKCNISAVTELGGLAIVCIDLNCKDNDLDNIELIK